MRVDPSLRMSTLARILAGMIALLGPSACLKPNPLAQIELAGDDTTDTGSDSDPSTSSLSDMLEPSDTGAACDAPPELEPACGACLVASCCTSLAPCGDDAACVCLADCLFGGGSENQCRNLCDEKPADVEPLAPLLSCATQDCPDCYG